MGRPERPGVRLGGRPAALPSPLPTRVSALSAASIYPWSGRWTQLARSAGLSGHEPVVVALSGGADSVFLLHAVARAEPRPRILAVHVDHGLRGEESQDDASFCARACARLGVPFARRAVELEPDGPDLEARARAARYRALAEEAAGAGIGTVLTGHHEDDALETLLMRWLRGSYLPGLPGLRVRNVLRLGPGEERPVAVVRPLITMRREEVRRILRDEGIAWREDSSNQSPRFTRNRVRNDLLPRIAETCGPGGVDNLRAFACAVEHLEEELASRTAHLSWEPPVHAPARRSTREARVGGTLRRSDVAGLAPPLQRRALWRLISEGTGAAPSRALVHLIQEDLARERKTRRSLPGGWTLQLRADALHLSPPSTAVAVDDPGPDSQLRLPFVDPTGAPDEGMRLAVPGLVSLPDGRAISAEIVRVPASRAVPRSAVEVELDAEGLPEELRVRWARPGDRFRGLGAPGSRPLRRFLADAGIPRDERGRVPLVFAGGELVWVAGLRPCEAHRVRAGTRERLRLRLEGAAPGGVPASPAGGLFEPSH